MLPTTGYFKSFKCPFYETCICERPYCHYRHVSKHLQQDKDNFSELVSTVVHNVLKLNSSSKKTSPSANINITYHPTPISTLNKFKHSASDQPVQTYSFEYDVRQFNNNTVGYNPTPKTNIVQYIPSAIDSLCKHDYSVQQSSSSLNFDSNTNDVLSANNYSGNVPNYNDDFIDKFLSDPNIYESSSKSSLSSDNSSVDKGRNEKTNQKITNIKRKALGNNNSSNKERDRSKNNHKSDKSYTKNSNNKSSSDRHITHDSNSDKSKSTNVSKKHNSKDSKEKDKSSSENHKKSKQKSSNQETKLNSKSVCKYNNNESTKSNSHSNRKCSSKHSFQDTEAKASKENDKLNSKHKRHKTNDEDKSKKLKTQLSPDPESICGSNLDNLPCGSHEETNSKSNNKRSSIDQRKSKELNSDSEPIFESNMSSYGFSDEDLSDDEINSNTLEQCKKIFNEYQATVVEPVQSTEAPAKNDSLGYVSKKRVAYQGSSTTVREMASKPKPVKNAATVMACRYKSFKTNSNATQLFNESAKNGVCLTKYITKPKRLAITPKPPVKIAPVTNFQSLLNVKKTISETKNRSNTNKILMTTVTKGSKRVAHIPDQRFTDLPTVLQSEKSKLPVNVRSRYFILIVKECMKLYNGKDLAYERALKEELGCYLKCSVLTTYRNSCMLTINRLRKGSEGAVNIFKKDDSSEFKGLKFYKNIQKWVLTENELVENGYPRPGSLIKGNAIFKLNKPIEKPPTGRQLCARCKKTYAVQKDGTALYPEDCIYHPGRRFSYGREAKYTCCRETSSTTGCCVCSTHVFEIQDPSNLTGFVSTFEPDDPNDAKSSKIYALDCEMVYTTRGLELARVTIINYKFKVVYDNFVRPLGPILDCNTQFSGLTTEMLKDVSTNITDVQALLLLLINSNTILIGHSLESDLKALRLIHKTVIDTSVLFPHKMGSPYKRKLKNLASDYLQKIIQNNESGHDSAEDAITCMELVIWKLKEKLKTC